jgi:hypothetical protein
MPVITSRRFMTPPGVLRAMYRVRRFLALPDGCKAAERRRPADMAICGGRTLARVLIGSISLGMGAPPAASSGCTQSFARRRSRDYAGFGCEIATIINQFGSVQHPPGSRNRRVALMVRGSAIPPRPGDSHPARIPASGPMAHDGRAMRPSRRPLLRPSGQARYRARRYRMPARNRGPKCRHPPR